MKYKCIEDYYYQGLYGPRRTFTKGKTYYQVNTTLEGSIVFHDDECEEWVFNKVELIKHFNCNFKFGR
jgi:hypothetical protein